MDEQGKRAEGGNCKRVGPSSMRRRRRRRIGRRSALELQCVSGFQLFLFSWPRTCPNCVSMCPCRIHHFSKNKNKNRLGRVQLCPMHVPCPICVGHGHRNPNALSVLSSIQITITASNEFNLIQIHNLFRTL